MGGCALICIDLQRKTLFWLAMSESIMTLIRAMLKIFSYVCGVLTVAIGYVCIAKPIYDQALSWLRTGIFQVAIYTGRLRRLAARQLHFNLRVSTVWTSAEKIT